MVINVFMNRQVQGQGQKAGAGRSEGRQLPKPSNMQLKPLYGPAEDCDLLVHYSPRKAAPLLAVALDREKAAEEGYDLLWHQGVWYESNAESAAKNATVGPLPLEALSLGGDPPWLHVTMIRRTALESLETGSPIPPEEVVQQSLALTVDMRELTDETGTANLFDEEAVEQAKPTNFMSRPKVPYFKTKLDIRAVFDQTVVSEATLNGPHKRLKLFKTEGVYQPYLYVSDFWLLEKDYLPLNATLADRPMNLSITYSMIGLFSWSVQLQMAEQWMQQSEWGLTDTQRDSFMLKRLVIDTNPYFLAFSATFMLLHTVFSMLAFKNDIQFWRQNKSMQGLSARSMVVSFVCQLITSLYLLDSRETSRLILFEILLDTALAFWKLRKAVKVGLKTSFPFVHFEGQTGYEEAGTDKYDQEALTYMFAITTPLFIGYAVRSALYGKHRGWYSFFVSTAAGGVYTFGFVMMTPQLYINYKLKSVEHLPWRALTYKAMNTFVDDVAAFLIDMPVMHRLACFRDDIVFFIYIYQRYKYTVDKTRPSVWAEAEAARLAESADSQEAE
eukprot:CAMPEP_0197677498 /NCGR_PEP_ID=MMETSP1338-20131121/88504_1 /TAXON_ID=43686 ORGANISM="Pelagodinium beii, Strain RCC1491" /NCGR_SAMPLE_ID=MMETSP1338 /ASSEMBLY_ACC=CAM_ASM_000754 /LENGTH=557 /DNA_ID=CAMNT_0043258325 /DNA_START=14 /DNA_END=1684 /DNA_ORIENTATION=+